MAIIEGVIVGLGVHLGKRLIDRLWDAVAEGEAPVVDQSGHLGLTASHAGRTLVGREFKARQSRDRALLVGNFYLPSTVTATLMGDEIPLVLIVEETQREVVLFRANLDTGYEIYLPSGIYSFYVFLMDPDASNFYDAEIYAVGFPTAVDLAEVEQFELEDQDDIWNIVTDSPIEVGQGGSYTLDMILTDTDEVPEFPKSFSELLGESAEQPYSLTGTWQIEEEYEFGSTAATAYLVHVGRELHGLIVIQDLMDDGTELVIQEAVSGVVRGMNVSLAGTSVRVIRGESEEYYLDQWEGAIENRNTISGFSADTAGTSGAFVMTRVLGR